jgi:divalent metal cation (Fe/Co/Zn/Cd) transporter
VSLAMMGLSQLLIFDALAAMLGVTVDVLANFEVWKSSSIRHPFGLERVEVVAAFSLSVLLFFMGGHLVSHIVQHLLESYAAESHSHKPVTLGGIDVTALIAFISTLISTLGFGNYPRIGAAVSFGYMKSMPRFLRSPFHFLALSCSLICATLPLYSPSLRPWLDQSLACIVALSLCALSFQLLMSLGSMLLMSYSGPGLHDTLRDISLHPSVSKLEEAKLWQVHYGLCMANIRVRVAGSSDGLGKLRETLTRTTKQHLEARYGAGSRKWEVFIEFAIDQG